MPQLEAISKALADLAALIGGGVAGAVAGASGDATASGGGAADAKAGGGMPSPKQCDHHGGGIPVPPSVAGDFGPGQKGPEQKGDVGGDQGPGQKGPEQKGDVGGDQGPGQKGPEQKGEVGGRRGHRQGHGHHHSHGRGHRNHDHGVQQVQQVTQAPTGKVGDASGTGDDVAQTTTQTTTQVGDASGTGDDVAQTTTQTTTQVGDASGTGDDVAQTTTQTTTQVGDASGTGDDVAQTTTQTTTQVAQVEQSTPSKPAVVEMATLVDGDDTNEFVLTAGDGSVLYFHNDQMRYTSKFGRSEYAQIPAGGISAVLSDGTRFSLGVHDANTTDEAAGTPRDLEILGADGSFAAARTDDGRGVSTQQVELSAFQLMEIASIIRNNEFVKFGDDPTQSGNVVQQS